MKLWAGILTFVFLAAGYAYAADSGSIPAAQQPVVKEVTGVGTINLEAVKYPIFEPLLVQADTDAGCKTKDSAVFAKLRYPEPITTVSPSTGKALVTDKSLLGPQPTDLKLTLTSLEIPEEYRKSAKILVTWTVRIEGECFAWGIGHVICEPWKGTLTFSCPKGDVKTYLYANTKYLNGIPGGAIGQAVTMEMPQSKTGPVKQVDPTLTGTYVITADDFPDKQIPSVLDLQIFWENFTSLRIHSPDGMRNMIVNVIPYSKKDK